MLSILAFCRNRDPKKCFEKCGFTLSLQGTCNSILYDFLISRTFFYAVFFFVHQISDSHVTALPIPQGQPHMPRFCLRAAFRGNAFGIKCYVPEIINMVCVCVCVQCHYNSCNFMLVGLIYKSFSITICNYTCSDEVMNIIG